MSAVVDCAAYAQGHRVAAFTIDEISEVLKEPDRFVWIGLHEPTEELLRKIQDEFQLHDLAVEDAHRAHQRPKLERYGESLFVVLRTAHLASVTKGLELGETHLFVGPRYVVSVRHGPSLSYSEVRRRCESTPHLLRQGPGFVLHAILDFVVDHYFPIVEALEEALQALENELFAEQPQSSTAERIYTLKRHLVHVKRALSPLIDICNRLVRMEGDLIPDDTRPYFRDVYDHVVRINEVVDSMRELTTSALEAHLSLVSVRQNEQMKLLAGWAAIIAVPTMIAGVYGMNFKLMPELEWRLGYPAAMAAMLGVCGVLYYRFKRAGWL